MPVLSRSLLLTLTGSYKRDFGKNPNFNDCFVTNTCQSKWGIMVLGKLN